MCRTYGARMLRFRVAPALTGWANFCRASGAGEKVKSEPRKRVSLEHGRGETRPYQEEEGEEKEEEKEEAEDEAEELVGRTIA